MHFVQQPAEEEYETGVANVSVVAIVVIDEHLVSIAECLEQAVAGS